MAIFFEAKNIGLNKSFTILFNFYNNNSKIILTYFNIHIHISIRSLQNEAIKNDICLIGPLYKKTFLFVCSRSCQVKHRQIFNFGTNNFFGRLTRKIFLRVLCQSLARNLIYSLSSIRIIPIQTKEYKANLHKYCLCYDL